MLCHLLSNLLLLPIFVSSIFIYIISSSLLVYCFQCLHTTDFWYNQHPCHPFSYRASGILASSLERRVAQSVLCLRSEFQPALSSTLFRCGFRLRGLLMLLGNSGSCLSWFGISYSGAVNWFSNICHGAQSLLRLLIVSGLIRGSSQSFVATGCCAPPLVSTTASTIITPVSCQDLNSKK